MNGCETLVDDGVIRGVLATVDCQTRIYAQVGYSALTTGDGTFQAALTALLTIYIAIIGYRMMFAQGETRLSDAPGIALKIGAILALVTSWSTFQTLVFDVADRAPLEIAAIVSGPMQENGSLATAPVAGVQAIYDELTQSAVAYGKIAGPQARPYSSPEAGAAQGLSSAAVALFTMSAGVISAATLATGILTAIGPIFIALFLIPATRGLFVGWVRALVAAALTPLVGWVLIVLMLVVAEPYILTLAEQRRSTVLDPQTALSTAALIFVFAFAQMALVVGACVMAFGFHLPRFGAERNSAGATAAPASGANAGQVLIAQPSRAERLALDLQRDSAQAASRSRSLATAAQVAPSTRVQSTVVEPAVRLGDAYRRAAFTPRRAGAAR